MHRTTGTKYQYINPSTFNFRLWSARVEHCLNTDSEVFNTTCVFSLYRSTGTFLITHHVIVRSRSHQSRCRNHISGTYRSCYAEGVSVVGIRTRTMIQKPSASSACNDTHSLGVTPRRSRPTFAGIDWGARQRIGMKIRIA